MGWYPGIPKWEYRWIVSTCDTGYKTDSKTDKSVTYFLQYPGVLKVKCTIEYTNSTNGQKTTLSPEASITVPPPDGLRILSGNNVSKMFDQANPTIFQVTCQGQDSMYFSAFAQERITKFVYVTSGKTLPNKDWVPQSRNSASVEFFRCVNGRIEDAKLMRSSQFLRGLVANSILFTCHQDIRISIVDPCGSLMPPIVFSPGYNLTATKDSQNPYGGTYTIDHN